MTTTTHAARDTAVIWTALIAAWATAQAGDGLAATTIDVQRKRLRRFAAAMTVTPGLVPREHVTAWLDGLGGSPRDVKAYRQNVRAFYRWAVASGLATTQPVPDPHEMTTRYGLDEQWQDALTAWESFDAAAGIRPATIAARMKHVQRFAKDAERTPWAVTHDDVRAWLDGLTCSDLTRQAHLGSLRAFYGWARRAGHTLGDPCAPEARRLHKTTAPDAWAEPIRAHQAALRAEGKPETTVAQRGSQLTKFAREHASLSPWAVTLDDVLAWMGTKRWALDTRRSYRSALVVFYRWAERTGRIDATPLAHMPAMKAGAPMPRPADEDDVLDARLRGDERVTLAVRLASELGMRCGEVSRVHSRDLEGDPGAWMLTVHGKGGKPRRVPVPDGLAAVLTGRPRGFVFPGRQDGHISPGYMSKLVGAVLPAGVTMHALRHRFATRAYGVGRDLLTLQQLLGHSSPSTTQRYVQVSDEHARALVAAVAA